MRKNISVILFILLLLKYEFPQDTPRYIFLFIGDGMGLSQVFLTERFLESQKKDKLVFLDPSWKFGLIRAV